MTIQTQRSYELEGAMPMYICCKNPDVAEVNEERTVLAEQNYEIGKRKHLKCLSCGATHEMKTTASGEILNNRTHLPPNSAE
jgi:hypothetical protein